jgi:tRNA(Ile)-lysidine synthase
MLDVLARLAPELGIALEVVSIDHGLRPEAGAEVELARAHAERRGLPFHALRISVPVGGGSFQARARAARYAALRELARQVGATKIAVGHTRDDQAETVLARLLRGAGPRGLSGIAPRRPDGVIRPLIDASRREVRAWIDAHALACVEDPTNLDARFQRARIRSRLLPLLEAENPAIAAHLAHLADDARALSHLARTRARRLLARATVEDGIDASILLGAHPAVRVEALRIWAEALSGKRMRRAHLEALEAALRGKGEARLPEGWVVRRVASGALVASSETFERGREKRRRDTKSDPRDGPQAGRCGCAELPASSGRRQTDPES